MGLLTLAQARDELWLLIDKEEDYDPSSASADDLAQLDRWLLRSYLRVQLPTTYEHPENQTRQDLTLATDDVDYTSVLYAIDHVRYVEGGFNLKHNTRKSLSEFIRDSANLSSGRPSTYAKWGSTIYIDRKPSSSENGHTLEVYGYQIDTDLAASGAFSQLHTVWDAPIITGAAWFAWLSLGDEPRADYYRETFAALVNDNRSLLDYEANDTLDMRVRGPSRYGR